MSISALPPVPQPTDDTATFNTKAFALVAALPGFVDEANALGAAVTDDAEAALAARVAAELAETNAEAARDAAQINAQAAAASAGAIAWVSGATYAIGDRRWSLLNGQVYRRRTAGAGTTDPRDDPTNWAWAGAYLLGVPVTGATHTVAEGTRAVLRGALQQTISPPPSPVAGDRFGFKVANARLDALIDWQGQRHEGLSDATTALDREYVMGEWVYIDNTYGWCLV